MTSFVLPLGATINLDGSALYEIAVVMFMAQAYGLDLSFTTQIVIALLALLTSTGIAGIPSASLVAISVILTAVGLPLEGLGVILAVDRILETGDFVVRGGEQPGRPDAICFELVSAEACHHARQ